MLISLVALGMKPAKVVQWETLEGTVVRSTKRQVPERDLYFFNNKRACYHNATHFSILYIL